MELRRNTSNKKESTHTTVQNQELLEEGAAIELGRRSHQMEMLIDLERAVLAHNAISSNSLKDTIDLMLLGLNKIMPGTMGSVLLLEENGTNIKVLSAPGLPEKYSNAINGVAIGPKAGSCGTAMYTRTSVIVEDIGSDALWEDYRELALSFHLRACWSVPLIGSGNHVIGSFAMYYSEVKSPTEREMEIVSRISNIARIIIDNKLAEEKIHFSNTRYDLITTATNDMIWDWNLQKNTVYRSKKGLEKVFGVLNNAIIENPDEWFKRVHKDDLVIVLSAFTEIMQNPQTNTFGMEYRFATEHGSYNFVHDRGYVIRDATGKPLRIIGAAQNINERKRLEQELVEQEVNKQRLIAKATIEGQENERMEIGRELHDNINQVLTTSKLLLDLALSDPQNGVAMVEKSRQNIVHAINEIRRISKSLVPPSIGDLGLKAAIMELVDTVSLTSGLLIDVKFSGKTEVLSPGQKLTVFRIIQEQMNNIVRHAAAENVNIHLRIKPLEMELMVEDDGKGFKLNKVPKGLGLKNISNRCEIFGGKVTIHTAPGKGCKLNVWLPIPKQGKNK